ncbi:MAG: tRNA ((37)-N6)-dimethylallyltransferase MiaA [Planctomycetota bacterium]|jgi:tRNA dimethylallyltransferase
MAEGRVIVVMGPTASGKSALALAMARAAGPAVELVSADSMQVYRGMDIGTAKPTTSERSEVIHHGLDLVDPTHDGFTVEDWLAHAHAALAAIHARGGVAIVVGGTNLYAKALIEGLFDGPPADPALREELGTWELDALRSELVRIDPVAAERIHRNDRRRTIRAIEVHRATGTPISVLQAQWRDRPAALPAGWSLVGLSMGVEANNRRINARVRGMRAMGLVDEVRSLLGAGGFGAQAATAVGYRELIAHLHGAGSEDDAFEAIKIATRQLAKQQRTWLKRFADTPGSTWIDAGDGLTEQRMAEIAKISFA